MPNSYDTAKVPQYGETAGLFAKAVTVTPDDDNDLAQYAHLVLLTDGNVCFLPARNDDGATITMALKASDRVPFLVRRLMATGTTATVAAASKAY